MAESSKEILANIREQNKALAAQQSLAAKLADVLESRVEKSTQGTKDLASQLTDTLRSSASQSEKLATLTQQRQDILAEQAKTGRIVSKNLLDQLDSSIQLLETDEDRLKTQEAIKEKQDEMAQGIQDAKDKAEDLKNKFMAIATDPVTAITAGLVAAVALIGAFAKEVFTTTKELGLTAGQGLSLANNTKEAAVAAKLYGGSTQDALQAASALSKEAGGLQNVTSEAVTQATELSVRFGLGAENAAKLTKAMMDVTDGTTEGAAEMQSFVVDLAKANDVAPGAVLQDIAADTETFARFGAEGAKEFIKTSIAAKKLGIEMSSITAAATSLLNIEDSIAKQMEAEVLLGRQINLDAARQAAYQNDYLTLTKELAKQVGSVAEFNSMSAIEQQALADALGMSVADTRKMVENQDKLAGLSEEALQHYKETGEIQGEGKSLLTAQNAQMAMQATTAAAALVSLGSQLGLRTSIFGMAKATAEVDQKQAPGGTGGLMESMKKIKMSDVIKGAAAMLIVAAAVFVFGKAVQEFMNVSWEAVGMAVVSMLALVGAVALLGAIMMSGVGALAIIAGAAAMLIVAGAMLVLAVALKIISDAIPNFMLFIPMLPEMAFGFLTLAPLLPILPFLSLGLILFGAGMGLSAVGVGLFSAVGGIETITSLAEAMTTLVPLADGIANLGAAFISMAFGVSALALSLLLLTPALPALAVLSALGLTDNLVIGGGTTVDAEPESEAEGDDSTERLIAKLDELISVVSAGGTINLDGKKVGDVIALTTPPLGA